MLEYILADLGAGTLSFLGNKVKPLLALRATPLHAAARLALGGLATAALVARLMRRRG